MTRPAIRKVAHFKRNYPHKLISTEWRVLLVLYLQGKRTTYNPDFYDCDTGQYIEIATSRPNIHEQRAKWKAAIRSRVFPLKVYWWEGEEITTTL